MNKKNIFIFSTGLIILILDQLTKLFIRKNLQLNKSIPIIKDVLHLTYITNTGSAFGLFKNFNLLFIIFSIIVIITVLFLIRKVKENERFLQIAFGFLLGGTLGNLIDRLISGTVTDFIDFRIWPVFNVADSAVTVSVIIFIILLWEK